MKQSTWLRLAVAIWGVIAPMAFCHAGYYNITITSGLNLIGFPFQKIPATQGVVTANDGTTITDGGASWAAGFFNAGVVGSEPTGASTFYVEITGGAFEGRHMYIESNTDTTLTITGGVPADIAADELVGASYKIVAANRIRDLFGEPGEPLLDGAADPGFADNILAWTGSSWGGTIFYQVGGFPMVNRNQWIQSGAIVNDKVVDRDEAVFVRRRGADPVVITLVGEVPSNARRIVFAPGLNLIGGLISSNQVIGASGLSNAMAGGTHPGTADTVFEWAAGHGWRRAMYLNTADMPFFGLRPNRWYRAGADVHDTFSFDPAKGYFIRIRSETPGIWRLDSPLAP